MSGTRSDHPPVNLAFADPIPGGSPAQTNWYQYFEWPDGSVTRGKWDYRGKVDDFLGHQDFAGKSVLELGPASGFLTKELEARGAAVTCIDNSDDEPWELVPRQDVDYTAELAKRRRATPEFRKAWWYTQRQVGGSARIAYVGVRALRDTEAHFDLALVACILQHLRDPLGTLFDVARLADRVIVTEPIVKALDGSKRPLLRPAPDNEITGSWWLLPPDLVTDVMAMAGLERVSHDTQVYRRWDRKTDSDETDSFRDREFYTSVFSSSPQSTIR